MFIIKLTYEKPIIEIEANFAAHRDFLNTYYQRGIFIASGPQVPREGGIIIVSGKASRSQVEKIIEEDPFKQHKLASYEIVEFEPSRFHAALCDLV